MNLKKFFRQSGKFFCVTALLVLNSQVTFSQNPVIKNSMLNLEWGNTIFGNTISIGYNYSFSKHFSSGISFGTGYFQYFAGDNNSFNWVKNIPGSDNTFSVDFKQIIDLKFDYKINRKGSFVLFNKFEFGLSYTHFLFIDRYFDKDVPWKGEKDYSWYLLSGGVNLISYNPSANDNVNFDFGIKTRFTFTGSPMTLLYYSPGYTPVKDTLVCSTGLFFWFYPEMYLRINYIF